MINKIRLKKIVITLLKLGLVAGILYYLVQSGRLNFSKLKLLLESPTLLVSLFFAFFVVIIPLAASRWWLLLKAIGLPVLFTRTLLLTWIGNFFNTTLPGAISGDLVKGYYIIKEQANEGKTRAFTTLLIDRFVGLFGLIVMAFCALVWNFEFLMSQSALQSMMLMISGLFAGTMLFYVIVLFPFKEGKDPFIAILKRLPGQTFTLKVYSAFKIFQHKKWTLLLTLGMSVMIHSCIAFIFFQIAQLIGAQEINLPTQLFIMPIGLISITIPIAPGGLGVGHAMFEFLYHIVGSSDGADIFNVYVILSMSINLLGSLPYFFYGARFKIPANEKISVETPLS